MCVSCAREDSRAEDGWNEDEAKDGKVMRCCAQSFMRNDMIRFMGENRGKTDWSRRVCLPCVSFLAGAKRVFCARGHESEAIGFPIPMQIPSFSCTQTHNNKKTQTVRFVVIHVQSKLTRLPSAIHLYVNTCKHIEWLKAFYT